MHLLDNPIWNALTTRQEGFAQIDGPARKFPSQVTTLAGFADPTPASLTALGRLLQPREAVGLFLMGPVPVAEGLIAVRELPLVQMWYAGAPEVPAHTECIELGPADVPEMVALAKLTEPGPFGARTRELGTYLGIRWNGELAAMAGERLTLPGYTEISAVCTHPRHSGRGYATRLVAELTRRILGRGERPFLHVREDNTRAVDVYRRLGFVSRTVFHLMVVGTAK
jgi:predicted GNAT family acetyltransferase